MHRPSTRAGSALMLCLIVIVALAGMVTAGHMISSSQILLTARSADVDSMQATAEGLIDYAYGVWRNGMVDAATPLTTSQATALVATGKRPTLPAWMQYDTVTPAEAFTIKAVDAQGAPLASATTVPTKISTISQQPKGWQALSYQYVARVTLTSNNSARQRKVTLEAMFRHDLVPPVGGLFYTEGDFELYKPAPMIIGGNVHTNANGYVSTHYSDTTNRLRFLSSSNISFVGNYAHSVPPGGSSWSSPGSSDVQMPTYDRGYANQVTRADKLEGIGMGTASEFDTTDTNPNNDGNRELIEPPSTGFEDPEGIKNSRIYNNAGLVIEISGPTYGNSSVVNTTTGVFVGTNVKITAKNGTSLDTSKASAIIKAISNTSSYVYQKQTYYTQSYQYDKRESANVLTSDVNMSTLKDTLNTVTGFNDILYINNTASANQKAIRLTNAGVLPDDGLTVATEGGLYVVGDYNTGTTTDSTKVPSNVNGNPNGTSNTYVSGYTTKPAALAADAVMFLSNSWDDANASKSVSNRVATHTTINSAVIAGYIPSQWTNPATNTTYGYSGGANNFPRFLENWNNKGMTFNGAFVQLFRSKMFVGQWDTGDIYSPPNRRWSFDKLLLERVIPGIPAASVFSRGQLRPL